ncbi:aminopeptidase O isoform X2 [Hemibagrus wyckioides]|uniref:aminopeptidase O isoform X2 n=1 Tax=Hemibagrus wyckioides TaxID=337641 RepID=UPI00266BA796|nr:aminopeptidase O isoform X2 [Hemibagrus wyckioides]
MESNQQDDLEPNKDDLPLRANTNHILVRHYVLDLSVDFQTEVIGGSIVLFLEPCKGPGRTEEVDLVSKNKTEELNTPYVHGENARGFRSASEIIVSQGSQNDASNTSWDDASKDFTLILDCCDLVVSKVEEVDVCTVSELWNLLEVDKVPLDSTQSSSFALVQRLMSIPSARWRQQQDLYLQCSCAQAVNTTEPLLFHMDQWSLQIRKKGVRSPHAFPRALRIWYKTKPSGGSVRWTKDQDGRCCVYTMGSPINNRALFPCQEPPVAMSTWQAHVKAQCEYMVLMSGENQAVPVPDKTGFLEWDYYVTMPMPASTFTIAVGKWQEAKSLPHNHEEVKSEEPCAKSDCKKFDYPQSWSENQSSHLTEEDEKKFCAHVDYPCRFMHRGPITQAVIPHRVFAPSCHLKKAESTLVPLLPFCLAAAHSVLGIHPFSRLDVLIVPPGFSSLGMASPHIIFLSQSVLAGNQILCGTRLCHEIAHSWFGLAIGARDWTEEWISEGFATYLEDVFWAQIQQSQMGSTDNEEQKQLKALLRWRRLKDELENSEEELQVLRPNKDTTGEVSESGASIVKHALNPGKPFMQVHYLKGYFLLMFLAEKVGEIEFLSFFRHFVRRFHGQLILSQDFLQMFLDTFPALESYQFRWFRPKPSLLHIVNWPFQSSADQIQNKGQGLTLESIYSDWLDTPGIAKWLGEASSTWSHSPPVAQVSEEVVKWKHLSGGTRKGTKRKRAGPKVNFKELNPWQLVLLLEFLLEEAELSVSCLSLLQTTYKLCNQDAEVKHRWCELVVKHKYAAAYRDVEHFLIHDQAMGVYLYGELMLQEDGRQQALARRCLSAVRDDMDQSARKIVEEMIL